jgi:iron(III) transport system ATP-binding protein
VPPVDRSKSGRRQGVDVELAEIGKSFDGKRVLEAVSLAVAKGEFFTLLGPSGCGKTTLLRAIAGFTSIDSGSIRFNGTEITGLEPWRRNIGFVFQNYALWPNRTVFENVAFGLRLRKLPQVEVRRRVEEILSLVELEGAGKQFPAELSGGMQQRTAIARALVIEPDILLLDEPLSNLDAKLRVNLRREIQAIQRRLAVTTIYVTHDQEEALEISDRIAVMSEGRVVQTGPPEEVYCEPATSFVAEFVGSVNLIYGIFDEMGCFAIAAGSSFQWPSAKGRGWRGPGILAVRPEDLVLAADGDRAHLEGRIRQSHYSGTHRRYEVDAPAPRRLAFITRKALALGSIVRLRIERAHWLPESRS